MNKTKLILTLLLPLLQTAVTLLRTKDENSTGKDDLAADALEFAGVLVAKYLVQA